MTRRIQPRDDLREEMAASEGEPADPDAGALTEDDFPDDRQGRVVPATESWTTHLVHRETKKGHVTLPTSPNVAAILRYCPQWQGVVALDDFREQTITTRVPPWPLEDMHPDIKPGVWQTTDTTRFISWASRMLAVDFPPGEVERGLASHAETHRFHPVRAYLDGLTWDGEARAERWLPTYCGTPDGPYERGVGVRWLRSAVARVLYPGCQVDCVLILEGPQGVGKTSVYRSLVPVADWYQDTGIAIGEKDSYDALRGVWIYGLDELDSLRRGDLTRTKNFITSTRDHYRQAYDTRARDFLRQCVFGGTTNEDKYLADRTGNRRFLPVRVGRIDLAALVRDRDQVWAEIAAQVRAGAPWHVDTAELRLLAEAHQAERQQVDPWVGLVETWLATPTELVTDGGHTHRQPFDARGGVTTSDVLIHCLGMRRGELTTQHEMRAGHALRACGLERRRTHNAHGNAEREYRYFPPDPDPADVDR